MTRKEEITKSVIEQLKNLGLLQDSSIRLVICLIMAGHDAWVAFASVENEFSDMGSSYKEVKMNLFWSNYWSKIDHKKVSEKDIRFEVKIMPMIHFSFDCLVIETCLIDWYGSEIMKIYDPIFIKGDEVSLIRSLAPGHYFRESDLEYEYATMQFEAGCWGGHLSL
jgi:hypothetical protein